MNEYVEANRALWDEWAALHPNTDFYDVEGFVAGRNTLYPFEIEAVGDVRGRSLLHLQCHFGMDTLSWARQGARVTGVDFSEVAVATARELAAKIGAEDARFVCSELAGLPSHLDERTERFDVVYTSRGVLGWLPDLAPWGEVVGRFLKPGGTFYMHEFHPVYFLWADEPDVTEHRVAYPYFRGEEPIRSEAQGSYADPTAEIKNKVNYGWPYTFAEILNSLADNGVRLVRLEEHDTLRFKAHPLMTPTERGWVMDGGRLPVAFSVLARKE